MANNQLLASDNFASGSLAAGWTILPAGIAGALCKVVVGSPNVSEATNLNEVDGQYWSALTWPNDQASEITLQTLTATSASSYIVLFVRQSASANTSYQLNIQYIFAGPTLEVALYVNVSGTQTQLGSTVTGLTFTAGDIWTLQVAGSLLTVYQNYNQIIRYADTQVASGSPGYAQLTATLANSKVSSWRGYSAVQQDGIWTKQGIVLPAASTDFSAGGGGQANASMLYEGNAQLLSGTVYKMWFSAGHPSAETNTYYAESSDGKSWTRKATAVIANFGSPFVIKNGSTYYLYCQPAASPGSGNFALYTSTDGINWVQQSANVFGLGVGGQWDDTIIWYFQPVAITNGTWYALYSAGHNATSYQLSIGLATSTDGAGLVWTRYVGNPVLQGANSGSIVNSCALAKVGSAYYMWMFGNQPGFGDTHPNLNPGEGIRYKTTDFIHWTNPVHSVHRFQMLEGLNFIGGQSYPNGIFTVGNQTYMYVQAATSDGVAPSGYQIELAIAPATITQIVGFNEDAVSQVATDVFGEGAGPLPATWTVPTGGSAAKIVAGPLVEPTAINTRAYEAYTGATFSNDQYSELTIQTLATASDSANLFVRMSLSALSSYAAAIPGPIGSTGNAAIYVEQAGSFTQLGPIQIVTVSAGDVWRLSIIGNVLTLFQNGFTVLQVQDINNTITSGFPGFGLLAAAAITNSQMSLWAGGNANVIPAYPSGASSSWLTVAEINSLRGLKH